LYTAPSSSRFALAICLPELSDYVHQRFISKVRLFLWYIFFLLVVVMGLSVAYGNYTLFAKAYGYLGVFFIFYWFEYEIFVKSKSRLAERSLFFHWILSRRSSLFWVLLGMSLCGGISQMLYLAKIGDLEALVMEYGVYYRSPNSGEWWRYFFGSFIHSDFMHWLANFSLLLIATGLAGPVSRNSLIVYFLIFLAVSAFAVQFPLNGVAPDALVGISGGVFGLYGWIVGNGYRNRLQFPQYYYLYILVFTLASMILAAMLNLNTSSIAHLAGFAFGVIFGFFGLSEKHQIAST
jgi:membrane associated rhomboid family serine protease